MKTLVFSDTHLGKYDKKKDEFLKDLIKDYDRIIINGDFYDSWLIDFKDFVNSEYKELLDLLKEKDTFYLFGNHDYKNDINLELAKSFSNYQGEQFDIRIGEYIYHFEPGNRFVVKMNRPFYKFWYKFIDLSPNFLRVFLYKLSVLGYKIFPRKMLSNKIGMNRNKFIKSVKPKDVFYVVGDTHIPEIDIKNKFINTGCIIGDLVSYLAIDENGNPNLVQGEIL